MNPLISVLIPTFNRFHTLEQCVRSVLNNHYRELQIVISDNGSTDETLSLARKLASQDDRIVVVGHTANQGPLANWRLCLDNARGELIHWLWSDDWVEPDFYVTMTSRMAARKACMAMCAAKVVNPEANLWHIVGSNPDIVRSKEELLKIALRGSNFIVSPAAALLPSESVRQHFTCSIPAMSGLNCNIRAIGCDIIMILGAIMYVDAVVFCPEPLVNFRQSASSITCQTDLSVLASHYAWARIYWARKQGIPRHWLAYDYLRLARNGRYSAMVRGLL